MFIDIIQIAILCIIVGSLSIPMGFNINTSPVVVWVGNALGSWISAVVVIYVMNRLTSQEFKDRISKRRIGRKIVSTYDQGSSNKRVKRAQNTINKRGLKLFALFCALFPGVFISTIAVYLLDLDKKTYIRWMYLSVIFISGIYVFGFWWLFVR